VRVANYNSSNSSSNSNNNDGSKKKKGSDERSRKRDGIISADRKITFVGLNLTYGSGGSEFVSVVNIYVLYPTL